MYTYTNTSVDFKLSRQHFLSCQLSVIILLWWCITTSKQYHFGCQCWCAYECNCRCNPRGWWSIVNIFVVSRSQSVHWLQFWSNKFHSMFVYTSIYFVLILPFIVSLLLFVVSHSSFIIHNSCFVKYISIPVHIQYSSSTQSQMPQSFRCQSKVSLLHLQAVLRTTCGTKGKE